MSSVDRLTTLVDRLIQDVEDLMNRVDALEKDLESEAKLHEDLSPVCGFDIGGDGEDFDEGDSEYRKR